MRIHCDACDKPVEQDAAVLREEDDGEILYFCSEECAAAEEDLAVDRETERLDAPPR
jgi:ribosomal protein L24E